MLSAVKHQLCQKVDDSGSVQIFHFETDSDMVMIEGENGVTLSDKLRALFSERAITITGDASGNASYSGTGELSINIDVNDDSHRHTGSTIIVGTGDRVVVSTDNGITVSDVTVKDLNMLRGVGFPIQEQLDSKALVVHNHTEYVRVDSVGTANGIVPLGGDGKILAQYLPSYVDDVIEGTVSDDLMSFTATGDSAPIAILETGKLYSDINKNMIFRWGGTKLVSVGSDLALGETESTAYRGDRGKAAYDHSQSTHARADATNVERSLINGNVIINGADTVVYSHPTYTEHVSGLYKTAVDTLGHVTSVEPVTKDDIIELGFADPAGSASIVFDREPPVDQPVGGLWFMSLTPELDENGYYTQSTTYEMNLFEITDNTKSDYGTTSLTDGDGEVVPSGVDTEYIGQIIV